MVFFARGSGWAWDTAASAAEEATAPSGPCAGGWRHPGPAAAPGGAVPGPRRPGGGRTRRPSSLSGSLTGPDGPTGCRRVRAGPARGGVEASRSAWSAGSWRRRVRLPVGLGDGPGRIVPAPDLPGRPAGRGVTAAAPGMRRVGGIAHGPARRGSAHPAVVVDCIPGRGRRARDRRSHARRARRRGLGHGRAGPVHRSVVSGSSTRVGGLDARRPDARGSWPAAGFSRPSGGPVAAMTMPPPSRSTRSRGKNS